MSGPDIWLCLCIITCFQFLSIPIFSPFLVNPHRSVPTVYDITSVYIAFISPFLNSPFSFPPYLVHPLPLIYYPFLIYPSLLPHFFSLVPLTYLSHFLPKLSSPTFPPSASHFLSSPLYLFPITSSLHFLIVWLGCAVTRPTDDKMFHSPKPHPHKDKPHPLSDDIHDIDRLLDTKLHLDSDSSFHSDRGD